MSFQAVGSCVTASVPLLLSSSGILETSEPIASTTYWTSTVSGLVRVSLWIGMPASATGQVGETILISTNPAGEIVRLEQSGLAAANASNATGLFNMTVGDVLYLSISANLDGAPFASVVQYAITIESL